MTEPRRWSDSPDAPVGMRELLGAARPTREMDKAAFQRGMRRVGRVSIAPAATAAAISIWAKLAAAGAISLVAAGSALTVSGFTPDTSTPSERPVHSGPRSLAPPARMVLSAPAIPTFEEPAPLEEPQIERGPAQVVPAAPRVEKVLDQVAPEPAAAWVPEPTPRAKSTLSDEILLLDAAKAALARSPQTALDRVAQHRALYPNGLLAEERDLVELDALRRAGRAQEARDRARAWLARDPRGMHAARVRAILSSVE